MDIRYFLGANSAAGFSSHYDQILPHREGGLLRVLKGGSGCGKSTLMKKVAAHALQLGFSVRYIHCSSDPDSLDGILIPAAGYAVVDGTAPHVVEPELCGCGERYVDLSSIGDEDSLISCRHVLRKIKQSAIDSRAEASVHLAALAAVQRLLPEGSPLPTGEADHLIPELGKSGVLQTVFLSGHTPKGRMTFWQTAEQLCPERYLLRGNPKQITDFLRCASALAITRGCGGILCDSPLLPGTHAEHLLLPGAGIAFLSDTALSPCPLEGKEVFGSHPDAEELLPIQRQLLRSASARLKQALEFHDLLEEACAPFLNYASANRAALECCAELEALHSA